MREPSAAAVAEGSACVTELAKGVEVIEQQLSFPAFSTACGQCWRPPVPSADGLRRACSSCHGYLRMATCSARQMVAGEWRRHGLRDRQGRQRLHQHSHHPCQLLRARQLRRWREPAGRLDRRLRRRPVRHDSLWRGEWPRHMTSLTEEQFERFLKFGGRSSDYRRRDYARLRRFLRPEAKRRPAP